MTTKQKIELLRMDLQNPPAAKDQYLEHLLDKAAQLIAREGIKLQDTAEDDGLQIDYAAYLYRKRANDDNKMPRMLRWALNNRLFGKKEGTGCDRR